MKNISSGGVRAKETPQRQATTPKVVTNSSIAITEFISFRDCVRDIASVVLQKKRLHLNTIFRMIRRSNDFNSFMLESYTQDLAVGWMAKGGYLVVRRGRAYSTAKTITLFGVL